MKWPDLILVLVLASAAWGFGFVRWIADTDGGVIAESDDSAGTSPQGMREANAKLLQMGLGGTALAAGVGVAVIALRKRGSRSHIN